MLVGVDIGGTAIKIGAVSDAGEILVRDRLAFEKDLPFEDLVKAILAACRRFEAKVGHGLEGIGICIPGFVDQTNGVIVDGGGNVPAFRTASLPERLAQATGVPVCIGNDGVAAALGELHFGAGQTLKRFVLLTIGTGIGGAVVVDGAVVAGSKGEPPELGAIVLNPAAGQGSRTLEDLACASAFARDYEARSSGPAPDLPDMFRLAIRDPLARASIDQVSGHIAHALGTLINSLNLEACLIGGGVAAAGEGLIGPIRRRLPEFTWPLLLGRVEVLPARRGNDAGLLGAAWLASEGRRKPGRAPGATAEVQA